MIRTILKWVLGRIPSDVLDRILTYPVLREQYAEVLALPSLPDRESVRKDLFERYLQGGPICVLEFGVWTGKSMRQFVALNSHPDSLFFGFDSFEGLPEYWRPGYDKGTFNKAGTIPKIDDRRVQFVKGWFNQTLHPFLESHPDLLESITAGRRKLFVHFDADLYSSTLCVLANLAFHIKDYYCIFDEFTGDECRALYAASSTFGLKAGFYRQMKKPNTGYPWCVSGRIWKQFQGEGEREFS